MSRITLCPSCGAKNRLGEDRPAGQAKCGKCGGALFNAKPANLDARGFSRLLDSEELPVLVDFWAPWCGPCKMMGPAYEAAAKILEPNVRLVKVNTQDEQGLAANLGIQSIPTLALFKAGRELARTSGAMPERSIVDWVSSKLG